MKKYISALGVYKFFASLCIVYFHLVHFYGITLTVPLPDGKRFPLVSLHGGYIATDFFFMISGALMAGSIDRQGGDKTENPWMAPVKYVVKKYLRLFPVIIVSMLLSVFVLSCCLGIQALPDMYSFSDFVVEVSALHMTGLGNAFFLNDADWFVSALLIAVMAVYPIYARGREFTAYYMAPLAVVFILGYISYSYGHLCVNFERAGFLYVGVLRAVAGVLSGCMAHMLADLLGQKHKIKARRRRLTAFIELFCAGIILTLCSAFSFSKIDFLNYVLFLVILVIVLMDESIFEIPAKLAKPLETASTYLFFSHYYIIKYGDGFFQRNSENLSWLLFTLAVFLYTALVYLSVRVLRFTVRKVKEGRKRAGC